ncbi:MAG: hypothetical protein IRZ16_16045 [Myxococcaceae bacterium]|nr:hypothetical protein [Myxococcaceae bacterium]
MAEHLVDTCDFLDVLEEAALKKSKLTVTLLDGRTITDQVTDVVTEGGRDYVQFLHHERIAVQDIKDLRKARPTIH